MQKIGRKANYNLEDKASLQELYKKYTEQYNKSEGAMFRHDNTNTPGLRLNIGRSLITSKDRYTFTEFAKIIGGEVRDRSKGESILQVAQRIAKEQVYDIDRGFMISVKKAYAAGELFDNNEYTLGQINYKMKFDTQFRQAYFDKINSMYRYLKDIGNSSAEANVIIGQQFFGS